MAVGSVIEEGLSPGRIFTRTTDMTYIRHSFTDSRILYSYSAVKSGTRTYDLHFIYEKHKNKTMSVFTPTTGMLGGSIIGTSFQICHSSRMYSCVGIFSNQKGDLSINLIVLWNRPFGGYFTIGKRRRYGSIGYCHIYHIDSFLNSIKRQ